MRPENTLLPTGFEPSGACPSADPGKDPERPESTSTTTSRATLPSSVTWETATRSSSIAGLATP